MKSKKEKNIINILNNYDDDFININNENNNENNNNNNENIDYDFIGNKIKNNLILNDLIYNDNNDDNYDFNNNNNNYEIEGIDLEIEKKVNKIMKEKLGNLNI